MEQRIGRFSIIECEKLYLQWIFIYFLDENENECVNCIELEIEKWNLIPIGIDSKDTNFLQQPYYLLLEFNINVARSVNLWMNDFYS